jgi:glucokinase
MTTDGLHTVGVDIGGTTTRTVFYDRAGEAVRSTISSTPWGPAPLLDHISSEIEHGASTHALAHVGVGIPGAVLDGTVTMALNVGIDSPLAIAHDLGDRLGVPVTVENDVNAAALGAHLHLDGETSASLAYVSIGTGVAAGLVIDGQIVRGARGVAGEIGHIALPGHDRPCVCGQVGCVETVASGRALMAQMHAIGLHGDAVDLWDAADAGHAGATALRGGAVWALSWACYLTMMLVDVERVGIGGGGGIALGERLVAPMRGVLHGLGEGSPFVRSLALEGRLVAAPAGVELGALGADRSARRANANGEPAA